MLRYDADARLTPAEALCHPFFSPVFPFRASQRIRSKCHVHTHRVCHELPCLQCVCGSTQCVIRLHVSLGATSLARRGGVCLE